MTVSSAYRPETIEALARQLIALEDAEAMPVIGAAEFAGLKAVVDRWIRIDLKAATKLSEHIYKLSQLTGNVEAQAYGRAARAHVQYRLGHYHQAVEDFQVAIEELYSCGKELAAAELQKQLCGVYIYMGNAESALKVGEAAGEVFVRLGERKLLAELETNIGNLHCYSLNQYAQALNYYERAQTIFAHLGDTVSLAQVNYNKANALLDLDRFAEALPLYEHASKIYHFHEMYVYAAQADYHIAYLLFRQGQFNKALIRYYQVRSIQQQLGNEVSIAWCNLDMAEVYLHLSAFEESARLAELAHKQFVSSDNQYNAACALAVGALAQAGLGQLASARQQLLTALETFARMNSPVMIGLMHVYIGDIELRLGNAHSALLQAREAFRIFSRQGLVLKAAQARLVIARALLSLGARARAKRQARAVLELAQREHVRWLSYQCYNLLGQAARAGRQWSAALEFFRLAISEIEQTRAAVVTDELKTTFLRDKLDIFENALEVSLRVAGADARAALDLAERAKARSLADLIGGYLKYDIDGEGENAILLACLNELTAQLNWYNNSSVPARDQHDSPTMEDRALRNKEQIECCEREIAEVFRRLQLNNAPLAEVQYPTELPLDELQARLEADEMMIEYFMIGGNYGAFLITRDDIRAVPHLIEAGEVERELAALQFQLSKFSFGATYIKNHMTALLHTTKKHLGRLYQTVVAPLCENMPARRLVIVPHGLLHYVPFHALWNGEQYMIESHEISYAPSARVFLRCCQRPPAAGKEFLIFGMPDERAPEIVGELSALKRLYPDAFVLTGELATRANLERHGAQARIVHMATHGVFRPDNPMFSYLKLADGEFTFYHMFQLKLSAELVTLSACFTGVNRVFPGDELHGLTRGFLSAGVPSLLVSLWEADDAATATLMQAFYTELSEGKPLRTALASAQRTVMERWQHPYYWAPFLLLGKP